MAVTLGKIVELDELAEVVASHKAAGRRVVHCHGVFDLIHPGHLRHFAEAKSAGDVLVVTVTPDRFVNKGPGRPVFTEQLRAETLAALSVVDHVAVNRWPTAVETIQLLRPDVYAKGDEYASAGNDLTGKITEEEAAVVASGGQIVFTHDITFSSTQLLNQHFGVFSPEVAAFLADFRSRHSIDDVLSRLDALQGLKVAVVGDAIVDEYVSCRAYGMASKSASIAAQVLREEAHAGGALAVANHVAGFCGEVSLVTVLGAEDSREEFLRAHLKPNVEPVFVVRPDGPTTSKRRYVNDFLLTKMFESTRFNDSPLPDDVERELGAQIERLAPTADLVIVADFGQGMLGRRSIDAVSSKARFLAVNAQTNSINYGYNPITRYPRADYVSIDAEEAHLAHGDRNETVETVVEQLAQKLATPTFAVTRGQRGALVRAADGSTVSVPAFASEVVDSIGAGDAFLALTAPLARMGTEPDVLGFVGNAVGALAVRVLGNRESVDPVPLKKFVTTLLK
jgi:rfaE bifunctional protein nucleotidyltransferase chain/domain